MEILQIQQETGDVIDDSRNRVSVGKPTIWRSRAGDEVLDIETRRLIKCFLGECTGLWKPRWNNSKALSAMKKVVDEILEKHRYVYDGRY